MPRKIVTDIARVKALPEVVSAELGDDDTVTLLFNGSPRHEFLLTITDDYPHGQTFFYNSATQDSGAMDGDLVAIVSGLAAKRAATTPAVSQSASSAAPQQQPQQPAPPACTSSSSSAQPTALLTGDNADQHGMIQTNTNGSGSGAGRTLSSTPDFEDDYYNDGGSFSSLVLHDMEACRNAGIKVGAERVAASLRVTVYFHVADLVTDNTAMAWGLSRSSPFRLELRFDRADSYIKGQRCPEVLSITQDGSACRFGQQIKSFLENYLRENWSANDGWALSTSKTGGATAAATTTTQHNYQVHTMPSTIDTNENNVSSGKGIIDDQAVRLLDALNALTPQQKAVHDQLQLMGFGDELSVAGAQQSPSIERAVEICTTQHPLLKVTFPPRRRDAAAPPPAMPTSTLTTTTTVKTTAAASTSAAATKTGGSTWLFQSTAETSKKNDNDPNKMVAYSPQDGFLLHVVRYIRQRTPSANNYCVICDMKHLIGTGMLRPAVCERDICVFRFQQLSMGKDATDAVATGGGVIDLLVTMFKAAVLSSRYELITEPYPSVADSSTGKMVFDPERKNFALLRSVVHEIPSTKDFVGVDNRDQLAAKLANKNPMCLPLIEWIISSNRSLIVKLRPEQRLKAAATPHQFLFASSSPEAQAAFDERKRKHGSVFAWHGSPASNWHSICRRGLMVGSGTKLQVTDYGYHGRALYCAPSSSVSLSYAQQHSQLQHGGGGGSGGGGGGKSGEGYISSVDFVGMALCEIIAGSFKRVAGNTEWTVTDMGAVQTRFLFIFTNATDMAAANTMNTEDKTFNERVREIIATSAM